RGTGGRRLLRARGAGDPQVAPAPARRPDGRLRHELRQARRRCRRRRGARLAGPRTAHRPAEADRRNGRGCARLSERPPVPARAARRHETRRAPAVHPDRAGARRPRHRHLARRATREDRVLERVQGARLLVGGAAALLKTRRGVAFVALAAGLTAWYYAVDSVPALSDWWDVVLLACVLLPAVFSFDLI